MPSHGQQQRARCREHAKISLHFVRLLFVTRAEKNRIAAVPALFGLPCRQQRQRGYHLSDKRNRGSVSTFDRVVAGPPCRKRLLVEDSPDPGRGATAVGRGRVKRRSPPAIGEFTVAARSCRIAKISDELF